MNPELYQRMGNAVANRRSVLKGASGYDEAFVTGYLDSEANSFKHPNAVK